MKKILLITLSFLAFFIISTFFYLLLLSRDAGNVPSALIGKKVPIFEKSTLFDEEIFLSPSEFQEKISVVNFFATWCVPCRIEHPYLIKLKKNENIQIIGINYKDDLNKAKQWLSEEGNPYHDVIIDNNGMLAIDWGVYGIPETFVISSKGVVKYRQIGPLTGDNYDKFYKELSRVIND